MYIKLTIVTLFCLAFIGTLFTKGHFHLRSNDNTKQMRRERSRRDLQEVKVEQQQDEDGGVDLMCQYRQECTDSLGVPGFYACRPLTNNPLFPTPVPLLLDVSFSVCVPLLRQPGDECGCCGGACPEPQACPCMCGDDSYYLYLPLFGNHLGYSFCAPLSLANILMALDPAYFQCYPENVLDQNGTATCPTDLAPTSTQCSCPCGSDAVPGVYLNFPIFGDTCVPDYLAKFVMGINPPIFECMQDDQCPTDPNLEDPDGGENEDENVDGDEEVAISGGELWLYNLLGH